MYTSVKRLHVTLVSRGYMSSVKRLHVRGVDSINIITLYRVNMQFLFCVYLADIVFRVPTLGLMA